MCMWPGRFSVTLCTCGHRTDWNAGDFKNIASVVISLVFNFALIVTEAIKNDYLLLFSADMFSFHNPTCIAVNIPTAASLMGFAHYFG